MDSRPSLNLSMPAGRDVVHWIDNTSAKAALVHGYSGKDVQNNGMYLVNC